MAIKAGGRVRNNTHFDKTALSIEKAARMAGRDAIRAMRAEASRQIREKKRMKVRYVNDALTLVYPTRKDVLVWSAKASKKPIPIVAFPHRQTRKGVSVEVNVGKRTVIRSAFIATMDSDHEGVFLRYGPYRPATKGQYKGQKRQAIRELYTTRVSDAFKDSMPEITKRGAEVFRSTMTRVMRGARPK